MDATEPYPRSLEVAVRDALADTPVVVIQGARQVGKSTLAQLVAAGSLNVRQLTLAEFASGYAADSHAAARRFFNAGQLVEQRGFAGAGFAENAAGLALRDTAMATVKRPHRPILHRVLLA